MLTFTAGNEGHKRWLKTTDGDDLTISILGEQHFRTKFPIILINSRLIQWIGWGKFFRSHGIREYIVPSLVFYIKSQYRIVIHGSSSFPLYYNTFLFLPIDLHLCFQSIQICFKFPLSDFLTIRFPPQKCETNQHQAQHFLFLFLISLLNNHSVNFVFGHKSKNMHGNLCSIR